MIRAYRAADMEDLLDVWSRASAVAHPFLDEGFLERERQLIPAEYLPRAETWVFEVDGRVVGFVSLLGSEVGALFVDPDRHRQGIGTALLDRARDRRGALDVEVFAKNSLGRAFYEATGFRLTERRVHEETGFELLRLRLEAGPVPRPST